MDNPQTNQQLILLTLMALLAGLAEFMVIKALQIAHAGLVAPVQYTILIWATIYALDSVCGYPRRIYFHRRGYHYCFRPLYHSQRTSAPG